MGEQERVTGSCVQLRLFLITQLILTRSCCKGGSGLPGVSGGPCQTHLREGRGRADHQLANRILMMQMLITGGEGGIPTLPPPPWGEQRLVLL